MSYAGYTQDHFGQAPLMFYYEVTQACDLVCEHCRASAQENPAPDELASEQSQALIDQIATFPKRPTLVLTGGDPLKRPDIYDLIRHAVGAGLQVALTPSATPLATYDAFQAAHQAGVRRLGISLDGADAAIHDKFRGWPGSFERTLGMLDDAKRLGMAVQVNTSITRWNYHQIDAIAELLEARGIAMWSAFFLIPFGRGLKKQRVSAE
jgi:MoaA/NifB/PqqE/SkfB family radical SAM enzyme